MSARIPPISLAGTPLPHGRSGMAAGASAGALRVKRKASRPKPEAGRAASARRRTRAILVDGQTQTVLVQADESPLSWLASRRGRDGQALISPAQLEAGERLRRDFTFARLTPRVTTDWSALGSGGGGSPGSFSDAVLAAKTRLAATLRAVGPELSGVLLDVCCFLKGLETVERERQWPARTAKVVLGLGLDRLARHYGLAAQTEGRTGAPLRHWRAAAPDDAPDGA